MTTYVKHDGLILRRRETPLTEALINGQWKPFPEGKDIRDSATLAWHHGTPISEKDALEYAGEKPKE